jgi:conjugal transfer ATP-binding protein TraC
MIHNKINYLKNLVRMSKMGRDKISHHKKMSNADLRHMMGMDYERFSHLLPYRFFDEEDGLFINTESIGFACEVAPLAGANEEIINSIADMIKNKLDHTVCIQIMLVGSNKIGSSLDSMLNGYLQSDNTFRELGISQYNYLKHAALSSFHNKRQFTMPLRDYRCFVFINKRANYSTAIAAKLCDLRDEVMTELKSAGLQNKKMNSVEFLQLLQSLINYNSDSISYPNTRLDKYKELHEQAVDPSFGLKVHPQHLEISLDGSPKTQIVALSLKQLPDELALWMQADHFANLMKSNMGIPCPFVISVHFKCEPQERSKLTAFRKASGSEKKANSPYAKLIPGIVQTAEEWKKIRDDLSNNSIQLCKVYYNCMLFTDEEKWREHLSKAIAAFRVNGMDLYSIKYQQLQSYLAMMPFVVEQGLWKDLSMLGRLNTMTTWNLTNMLPIVAEYKGSQNGKGVLAPTFRHQAAYIDNFNDSLDNYNVCISATSGSGKSVLSQTMISSVLADGGKAWVIDLGQSYKKFCETLGGTYMDASNLRLNPFSGVRDISRSAESIRDLIAVMASPNEGLSDVQKAHLLDAVNYAYKKNNTQANIDDVIEYFKSIDQSKTHDLRIDDIVTLLKKYSPSVSSKGSVASRIFNEASLLESKNSSEERFIVLELGELENQPDLLKAVLFALILNIEEQMYHSEQKRKKLCVIDEAWRLLSGSNKTAAAFIEKGFRTARKHRGAFVTITQKINDFYASSEAQAAWSCAENKIIMRQNEKSFKDFLIEQPEYFSDYEQQLIQNFKASSVNGFSEFMVQQGSVTSFHRLFLDPFSRVMYSSRAEEHQAVKELVASGSSVSEAIMCVAKSLYGQEMQEIAMVGRA